jgi:hypothetical protein
MQNSATAIVGFRYIQAREDSRSIARHNNSIALGVPKVLDGRDATNFRGSYGKCLVYRQSVQLWKRVGTFPTVETVVFSNTIQSIRQDVEFTGGAIESPWSSFSRHWSICQGGTISSREPSYNKPCCGGNRSDAGIQRVGCSGEPAEGNRGYSLS